MKCKVMGIVNVTPDSFSDGGKYFQPEEAICRANNLIAEGADIIDFGAESTRPDATPITWQQEWERLEPVLSNFERSTALVSVDTYHPETAMRALELGVGMINCVYVESIPAMIELCLQCNAELVVPAKYARELPAELKFYLDPMIGFGTTREEDVRLLNSIAVLSGRGRVLVGASRKRVVKKLVGAKMLGKDIAGNLSVALYAANQGASCVRVHDVRETVQALKVWEALEDGMVP